MIYAVIGSRSFNNYKLLKETLDKHNDIGEIVSGGAVGSDSLAEKYAKENKIPFKVFKPNWQDFSEPCVIKTNQYGDFNALAGLKRNQLIIDYCDKVIAFWDGKSRGSKDSINKAQQQGKQVIIIKVGEK
jgi:predicted Rossmann fold nucleotide-binding protein DprA/Smf involved in DNA uptake